MKQHFKTLVLAAASVAAGAMTAHAQQSLTSIYTTGDLLAGFTIGSGDDLVLNLGTESSLANGQYWDVSALVGGSFNIPGGGTNAPQWGVIGANGADGYGTGSPGTLANVSALNGVKTALNGLGTIANADGGFGMAPSSTAGDGSWYNGTVVGGTSTFRAAWYNPNGTGFDTANFSSVQDNGSLAVQLSPGTFTLSTAADGDVILTYGTVPEPSTCALMSSLGILALIYRRRFARA